MKTVSGKVTSTTPISLSNAAKSLSKFAASHNHGASHAVSVYLQRAADSFNQLVKVHEKLNPNGSSVKKEHFTDAIKVEESHEVGLKVEQVVKNEVIPNGSQENKNSGKEVNKKSKNLGKEEIKNSSKIDIVMNEDIPSGSLENKKTKNLGKEKKNSSKIDKVKDKKLVKTKQPLDIGEGETENSNRNEDIPNGSRENKKSKNLGKEKNPEADMSNKIKNSSKIDKLDIVEGQTAKCEKNEFEFVKVDSTVKTELGFEEVKEDGMISKDKKKNKKKKKNRGVGDSESNVVKVEEDLVNKAEEEGKKRKSLDTDAGESVGSAEQSNKKKSKRRRMEGEK